MNKHSFLTPFLFAITVLFFASCDKDFNDLGADIVGTDSFEFGTPVAFGIKTTNIDLNAVESTNLPVNPLGIYNHPVYGLTKANFATQVELQLENPTIDPDLDPTIESATLTVPYFYTVTTAPTSTAAGIYELDSIYGPDPSTTKIKLSVFESGVFLRSIDPVTQLSQAYYTDQDSDFDTAKGAQLNNSSNLQQNDEFFFNKTENVETMIAPDGTESVVKTAAMKLDLSQPFFQQKILDAPAGKLLNNNIFKEYFKGLYFKVEPVAGQEGNLAMLNFSKGYITIKYHEYVSKPVAGEDPPAVTGTKTMYLSLKGNTVSLIDQANRTPVPDSSLYLKGGGKSSMVQVELFPDNNQLLALRANKWLINDASLTFTINESALQGKDEPKRVYLYDLNNKKPIVDFTADQSVSAVTPKNNKSLFDGIKRNSTYKIRLTKHIMNLVNSDTITNVKLGLVVTEDINTINNKRVKTPPSAQIKVVPAMSVAHPLGTVLFGDEAADVNARPKFIIYYTKPKQN